MNAPTIWRGLCNTKFLKLGSRRIGCPAIRASGIAMTCQAMRASLCLSTPLRARASPPSIRRVLAAALAKATEQSVTPEHLPINSIAWSADGAALIFNSAGKWWQSDLKTYALSAATRHGNDETSLPMSNTPHPSLRTGEETTLNFVNRTKDDVQLFWISATGQRQQYATLHPGQQYEQHTFAGHVWLVTDKEGKTLGVFEATEGDGDAVIDDKPRAPTEVKPAIPEPVEGTSPDGHWLAFTKKDNVYLRDTATGRENST